jgi:KaiC/GvpD/RAD55 family RecA-like ATPase
MTELERLLMAITQNFILDESWYMRALGANIDPKDWPAFRCKKIAQKYSDLRMQENHDHAALVCAESLDDLNHALHLSNDIGQARELYKELMLEHRGIQLSQKIGADPKNAAKYFGEYSSFAFEDSFVHFGQTIEDTYAESVKQAESGESEILIRGFPKLSSMIGGFNPGRVGMLIAGTGFGKTNFAANLALAAAQTKKVIYLNMEMIEFDFSQRLLMSAGGIEYADLKFRPRENQIKVAEAMSKYLTKDLYFSRGKSMSIFEIVAKASEHKRNKGLDLLIVDYDQKIALETSRETPEWKALQIAMEQLEDIAKRLKIFVLLLAQESSEGDVSGSKRSKFPASTVLRFFKDDSDRYVIQAIKNRFGKQGIAVEVDYEHSKNQIREREIVNVEHMRKQKSVDGFRGVEADRIKAVPRFEGPSKKYGVHD